jgi:hypothetical protein
VFRNRSKQKSGLKSQNWACKPCSDFTERASGAITITMYAGDDE